jgi:pyruvyltransferase
MLKAFWFNPKDDPGTNNFGDSLVPIILKWISGEDVTFVPKTESGKILCIGSAMAQNVLKPRDIVWGYGARSTKAIPIPHDVTFLSVRGPLTRQAVLSTNMPEIYGDPGALMPKIYKPSVSKTHTIGFIPHYVDKHLIDVDANSVLRIDITSGAYNVIDKINMCDIIVSTSLHGAIVAEAYGKPVVWLQLSDNVAGMLFKWNDYLLASGRDKSIPERFTSFSELTKHPLPTPRLDMNPMLNAWKAHYATVK